MRQIKNTNEHPKHHLIIHHILCLSLICSRMQTESESDIDLKLYRAVYNIQRGLRTVKQRGNSFIILLHLFQIIIRVTVFDERRAACPPAAALLREHIFHA